ncbi:S9 family peptidase (plasmid) [Deinococcus psychrotolerans]|uniref:S9 family peptidase n=1 Tax=Deinococcus psychrotolerans TaxID=2489213 RepID=A0A3G8YJB2_9DEIO|nr:S9 family peptidase [Deinococcus psychrotolerans]AZI45053.1 S9 family peptidase [Deinococcus psychrotolerans]
MTEDHRTVLPYGAWPSPITADTITAGSVGLGGVTVDGPDVYWLESRSNEGGRSVLVRLAPDGTANDVTPPPFNVRSRVHEYGGRCHAVQDGTVYFSHFADNRLYRQMNGQEPQPITPELEVRYADLEIDLSRGRLIAVREDHREHDREARNELVALQLGGPNPEGGGVLATGADFYASPRLSPDGHQLTWVEWNHPNMPWDETRLMLAQIAADGSLSNVQQVAGGKNESVQEPRWSPGGVLHFVSDRSGWWNLYRLKPDAQALYPLDAEFSTPQWQFGSSNYVFLAEERLMCAYHQKGRTHLARLEFQESGWKLSELATPFTSAADLRVQGQQVVLRAGAPNRAPCIARLSVSGDVEILHESSTFTLPPADLSVPEAVEFPTEGGRTAHAFLYLPRNAETRAPEGEKPPLLVMIHGGPTGATDAVLDLSVQFWTSRGVAVLDVNYGGSTGFGRAYRQRLNGEWGVVDVQDCVNAALYVAERGDADIHRLAITGGSAGGYTTLCALTFSDVFAAGASHYGVSDAEALAQDTHKFESRYLDSMIGPYPQEKARYQARSPIHFTEQLKRPVVFFQGLEDKVVPPDQARKMFEAVRSRGLPTALVEFEGEGHGFRRAENIKRALEGELEFYGQVFGFTPSGITLGLDIVLSP